MAGARSRLPVSVHDPGWPRYKQERGELMALQFLDKATIGSYLSAMWKRDLNTGEDPANGKWYENGANNDHIGLYGGLTDNAATQLQFDDSQKQYTPQSVVCNTATVDNLNGL